MRLACLFVAICAVSASGCTVLIIGCGENLDDLKTQLQVHKEFGTPVAIYQVDGQSSEEYFTHRKIADPWLGEYVVIGDVTTLGFGELIWFPQQLFLAAKRSIVGQQLIFTYDTRGNMTSARRDGEKLPCVGTPEPVQDVKEPEASVPASRSNPTP